MLNNFKTIMNHPNDKIIFRDFLYFFVSMNFFHIGPILGEKIQFRPILGKKSTI